MTYYIYFVYYVYLFILINLTNLTIYFPSIFRGSSLARVALESRIPGIWEWVRVSVE